MAQFFLRQIYTEDTDSWMPHIFNFKETRNVTDTQIKGLENILRDFHHDFFLSFLFFLKKGGKEIPRERDDLMDPN